MRSLQQVRDLKGLGWFNRDRYVGISGQRVAPEVYLAIGISGQLQHMIGIRGAKTIVAVNSDPDAPVFKGADFCLVGDLYKIVPALTDALNDGGPAVRDITSDGLATGRNPCQS